MSNEDPVKNPILRVRKIASRLSPDEWAGYAHAVYELHESGKFKKYVQQHALALNHMNLYAGRSMDGAHRCPAFLPWHRQFLLQFEYDLLATGTISFLPVWDWDSPNLDATTLPFEHLGGDGDPNNNYIIKDWAQLGGSWKTWRYDMHQKTEIEIGPLSRRLGVASTFPTYLDFARTLRKPHHYDVAPFNYLVKATESFRYAVEDILHNKIHNWVGGHMEEVNISANDPVFFMHHANIDRYWYAWQQLNKNQPQYIQPTPEEQKFLPNGQSASDDLIGFPDHRVDALIDLKKLDYTYQDLDRVAVWDTLHEGQTIKSAGGTPGFAENEELVSLNGRYKLCMQNDGNLVLYDGTRTKDSATWSSETYGHGVSPYTLTVTSETLGTLHVTDKMGTVIWRNIGGHGHSGVFKRPYYCQVQNDGNFVVYDTNRKPLWGAVR